MRSTTNHIRVTRRPSAEKRVVNTFGPRAPRGGAIFEIPRCWCLAGDSGEPGNEEDPVEDHEANGAKTLDRRRFLKGAGIATVGVAALGLAACTEDGATATTGDPDLDDALGSNDLPEINWEMATSWPTALDTIYGGAVTFGEAVTAMTGGKFTITARAAGELVPGLEVLQSVQAGSVSAGHTASYYYRGLGEVLAFGTAVPFGLTDRQQNAWLYDGGGLEMLQEIYRERFGVIECPAGNTGVQMGGWFNKEIASVNDLSGLVMRIPGLGGAVMERLGVTVQVIAGGEIFQALQTGTVDAAEWVGPYDDTQLDFQSVAQFYYYPGWWEPGPSLEVQLPAAEYDALPEEYQAVVQAAAYQANVSMMSKYDTLNPPALQDILDNSDVEVLPFPDDVMQAAEEAAFELYDEFAAQDTDFQSVFDNWSSFRSGIQQWHALAEQAMITYESQV
ncbi:MAG: ABC transporter substrate-binding protein [Actinobacteria bacterium]|nr:MAG: ABC transporter substrate-binding protein [Actinomycetota bacterium]